MSGKVTAAQINQTTLKTDDFRKAVNYENPKNKGYVRFEPDGKGGVKLAKVNNKIDLFINWRTNIDAEKNKAMRDKFADSISRDLKWADKSKVEKLAASIRVNGNGESGEARTDALGRKELQAAFKEYDRLMNSTGGRREMIDNLLKDAARRCGLPETEEGIRDLKNKFFPTAEDWSELIAMQDCNTDIDIGQPGHMKMDEHTFLAKLHTLELKCNDAIKRASIENLLRAQAETYIGAAALGNDFGLHLSIDDKAQLRGALLHFLSEKGLVPQNEDGGIVGTGGMVFETFVDKVLPELFKKCVADVNSAGENADRQVQMDANFSFDAIMEEAEKFMVGARDYISNPPEAEGPKLTGDAKFDAIIESGKKTVEGSKNMVKSAYIQDGAVNAYKNSNMSKADAKELQINMQKGVAGFEADGLLRTFTQKFLAERGIGEDVKPSEEQSKIQQNTLDSIIDTAMKVGIAAKLQYGSAKTDALGHKTSIDEGMGGYVADMEGAIAEIASGKNGLDIGLMGKLMSCTLANIANRKVELVAHGASSSLELDKASEADDKKLLKATADAYISFERNVLKTLVGAKAAFEKVARSLLKKGLITQGAFDDLIQRVTSKLAGAHKAALSEFFIKSPVEDAEVGRKMLERILKAKIAEAKAEISNELTVATLSRAVGVQHTRKLSAVAERVADALAQPGLDKVKLGRPGIVDEKAARAKLASGELKRLWTATLAAHLKDLKKVDGIRTVTEEFVNKVVADFNKKAAALVKSVAAAEDKFLAECESLMKERVKNIVEDEAGAFKGYITGPTPLTKSEKAELIGNFTAETLRFKTSAIRANVQEILDAPESFAKKDVKALAQAVIDDYEVGGAERTITGLAIIVDDRTKMVEDFLASDVMKEMDAKIAGAGVFGKGGALESAGANEKGAFIDKALGAVKARMKAMPLAYATGDKAALAQRVVAEALKAAEGPVKEWMKFRKDFMAGIGAIEADFAGMGKDQVAIYRDWTLMEILSGENGTSRDVKTALAYYRHALSEGLNFAIGKIKTSFDEYVAKVDKVLEPVKARFRQIVDGSMNDYASVMTPEALEHLKTVIVPKALQEIEHAVYRNPDNFDGAKIEAFAQRVERNFDQVIYLLFDGLNTDEDAGLEKLIKRSGAQVLLNDKVEADAAKADLRQWLDSSEGHAKLVACEKALLDHFSEFGGATFNFAQPELFAPTTPGNAVAEFRFAARDILKMHTAQMLYAPFDNERVGEAKEAFEKWVDSHGLSRYADFRNTTAKDVIMTKFYERIKALQEAALEGQENEPILTPSFIAAIDQVIDTTGVEAMVGEWKTKALEALQGRYLKKDDDLGYIFDPGHPRSVEAGQLAQKAASQNREMILTLLGSRVSAIAGELDAAEGLDKVREAISKIDMAAIISEVNDEVNECVEKCVRRYNVEEQLNRLYGSYAHSIERKLVKDAVGEEKAALFPKGLSDLLTTKIGADSEVVKAVGIVKRAIATYLGEAQQRCRDNDIDPNLVGKQLESYALACVETIEKDKLWQSGFISKSGLAVALQNAAKEVM